MPKLAYVGCVEISAHDADTLYVFGHTLTSSPTTSLPVSHQRRGKSWKDISGDLPEGEITRVVRGDAQRAGLLFVGTETGIFFSVDDGRHWQRMKGGLPVTPVYDLKIKAATSSPPRMAARSGSSMNLSPCAQWTGDRRAGAALRRARQRCAASSPGARRGHTKKGISYSPAFGIGASTEPVDSADGSSSRALLDGGENPPNGAIVYYWLPEGFAGAVALTFPMRAATRFNAFARDDKDAVARRSRRRNRA